MKVGDEVYCIKSRNNLNLKNNTYHILKIDNNKNDILISVEHNQIHINCHYLYHNTSTLSKKNFYCFEEYFISESELRKLKLKKLNES
jgi:hypothetical protein